MSPPPSIAFGEITPRFRTPVQVLKITSFSELFRNFHESCFPQNNGPVRLGTARKYWTQTYLLFGSSVELQKETEESAGVLSVSLEIPPKILQHSVLQTSVINDDTQKTVALMNRFFGNLATVCLAEDDRDKSPNSFLHARFLTRDETKELKTEDHSTPTAYIERAVMLTLADFNNET